MKRIKYSKVRKVQQNFYEYTGSYKSDPVEMQLFVYDEEGFEEYKNVTIDRLRKECEDPQQQHDVKWLNIHGLHDTELIREIGDVLQIEPFMISDVLNVLRRAKIEEYDDMLFFSIKSILEEQDAKSIRIEQVSFFLTDNLIVSFQERKSDFFAHIRERIRTGGGIVRKKKNDYLLYLMLDAIIENFFITIENYEFDIEKLLIEAQKSHRAEFLGMIEHQRENLNYLKRAILPLRDALYTLKSIKDDDEFDGIEKSNYTFFARLHQKTLEILEQIEYDMNNLESASNIFYSSQAQKMNQIMKTLTIFSVIFMPLTFIVGVYGMNFENMPELKTKNGYFIVLGVMFVTVVFMVYYFRRKKWF
ncbi:magnesium and cobalt transport protein CorA [Flavobacterium magnum]|uniref:Magnesium transport protein CorA n=1 Tax=Flavobacterium magnum TaxID=2162713 RepID=A0A2S0RH30_9FLAO|nr:magnesium/cobalt transporter CorA [Flavobacterium magnum]AWA30600.1 magnesium and cobalt transport protein CorA [Flavobacterium magnum]